MQLKIFVDIKAKKVVFAEAEKPFVDFIFQILTLPLASVTSLLKDTPEGMFGCLSSVCDSVNALKPEYFEQPTDKDSLLKSFIPLRVPLLKFCASPYTLKLFNCPHHNRVTLQKGQVCPEYQCSRRMTDDSIKFADAIERFVKSSVPFMVMDDLAVKPMNISLIKNYANDFDYMEEKVVEFGNEQALAMLRASLQTKAVLTTVFLGKDESST